MTPEEHRAMDANVAEKVMGWKYEDRMMVWYTPGAGTTLAEAKSKREWRPSEDVACAWAVVERMRSLGWTYVLRDVVNNPGLRHVCFFANGVVLERTEAYTAPLTICKAALAAIGAKP